jgi:N-acetylglutamate synthase-like GNAT family acetyltransferase
MVKLKVASLKEVPEVMRLIRLGVDEGALLPRTERELRAIARKGNIVVAVDSDRIVGVGVLDFYSRRLSELRSLYVKPDYQNTGVGRGITERIVELASKLGVEELMTITAQAKRGWFVKQSFSQQPHGFKVALFRKLR